MIDKAIKGHHLLEMYKNRLAELKAERDKQMALRQKAEEQYCSYQQYIENVFDSVTDIVLILDSDGRYTYLNKQAEQMIDRPKQDLIGSSPMDLFPHCVGQEAYTECMRARRENVAVHFEYYEPYLDQWLEVNAYPHQDILAVFVRNITERKEAEETLRESKQLIADIINFLPDAAIVIDYQGQVIAWNQAIEEMTGIKSGDILGHDNYAYAIPFYGERRPMLLDLVLKPEEQWERDYQTIYRKGKVLIGERNYHMARLSGLYLRGTAAPLYNSMAEVIGAIEIISDISDHRHTEEALRNSEEMYRRIVETANEGIGMTDSAGTVFFVNHKLAEMLGYDTNEIINMSIYDLTFTEDKSMLDDLRQRQQNGVKEACTIRCRRKDGSFLWTIVSAQPMLDNLGTYLGSLGMFTDISKNKKLELEMAHLDRLNLVGEIAAGIGHEIRNPMTAVRGFLQILGQDEKYLHDKEHFSLMIEELDRANSIISEFLSLTNNRAVKLEQGDINDIIAAILPLIQAEALIQDKYICINLRTIPDLLLDEREIRQLILNLVRNGLDAMQAGGILTIETYASNNEVVLAIKDQGSGLDESMIDRLGTPFVTTKDNGTGLGLPVCYSIAARHQARITFETSNEGSIFHVTFSVLRGSSPSG